MDISELIKNMFFIDKEEIISRTLKMLNFGFKNKQTIYSEIEKNIKLEKNFIKIKF